MEKYLFQGSSDSEERQWTLGVFWITFSIFLSREFMIEFFIVLFRGFTIDINLVWRRSGAIFVLNFEWISRIVTESSFLP